MAFENRVRRRRGSVVRRAWLYCLLLALPALAAAAVFLYRQQISLAPGLLLSACLLIYLYVHSELTYDAYNPQAGRIARVTSELSRTRQLSSAGAPSSFPRIISVIPSLLFFPFSIFPSLRAHPPALLPSRIQSFLAGA